MGKMGNERQMGNFAYSVLKMLRIVILNYWKLKMSIETLMRKFDRNGGFSVLWAAARVRVCVCVSIGFVVGRDRRVARLVV